MRRIWFGRAIVAAATILWLVAWGRVLVVGVAQPSRWDEISVTTADGQTVPGDLFGCRLNAFDRDGLIYRACDREGVGVYIVAVDPARRSAVASARLPEAFVPQRWFAAVAADPAGGLTILGADNAALARLRPDGTIEALPSPPDGGLPYGFGWRGGRLEIVAAQFVDGQSGPATLAAHTPGAGWSAPAPLPAPDCGAEFACTPLVATLAQDGWTTHYARAPRRPADPAQVTADILRVGPDGATQATQTVTVTAESRAYRIDDGGVRWSSRLADRSGGNVLNYGGHTTLRQGADGRFSALPTPPADLLDDGRTSADWLPDLSTLAASYTIAADRLHWRPTYGAGGFSLGSERALLRDDRWIVLQRTRAGLHLEERPRDPTASYPPGTFTARGPLILGQQEDVLSFSNYSAPLLPADDGGYWLLGRSNEIVRIGPDLRRLDGHHPLERFGHLFADFGGALDDRFHREAIWPKRLALGWPLFAWPPLALLAWLRGRRARDEAFAIPARLPRAALLFALLGLAALPWFWMATQYF